MRLTAGLAALLFGGIVFGGPTIEIPRFGGGLARMVPDRVLVQFRKAPTLAQFRSVVSPLGVCEYSNPSTGFHTIRLAPGKGPTQAVALLSRNPLVRYAEPDYYAEFAMIPNDALWGNQWDKVIIDAPAAWDLTLGDPNTLIAFTDSGIVSHEDLNGQFDPGWNVKLNNNNLTDDLGHGTKVVGYAAAKINNSAGVAGLAPNCRYMMIKINTGGAVTTSDMANGITYAVNHGARVVSTSIISTFPVAALLTATNLALDNGLVVIAAAGNSNNQTKTYPAGYTGVLGVCGTSTTDTRGWQSTYGTWVAVAAPMDNIWSCDWNGFNQYSLGTGTSYAAPQVAGEAGMIYGLIADPGQRTKALADEVRAIILANTDPVNFAVQTGRINVGRAINNTFVNVSGHLDLPNYSGSLTSLNWTLVLREPGTTNLVESRPITLDVNGNYSTRFTKKGTYDVVLHGTHWLDAGLAGQALVRGSQTLNFVPINGDVSGDNSIDIFDLNLILNTFGQSGNPNDVTGDGIINLYDLNVTLIGFGAHGF